MEIVYEHRYYTEPMNHSFLHYTDHYLHLRNILSLWVTNIDITRSYEILLRRDFVYYHLQATVWRKLFYALFNAQNMYVWQAKHARLAGETCTFGRRNMHVWQAKHALLKV